MRARDNGEAVEDDGDVAGGGEPSAPVTPDAPVAEPSSPTS
jgi:hypothetical protein